MRIVIPIDPATKKNSARVVRIGGHVRVLPSKRFVEYQNACGRYLEGIVDEPIDYPVEVKCVFHRRTRHRVDLTNLLEAIDDILTHYGVLSDDDSKVIVSHDGSRVRFDKENPRTEIEIKRIDADA